MEEEFIISTYIFRSLITIFFMMQNVLTFQKMKLPVQIMNITQHFHREEQ